MAEPKTTLTDEQCKLILERFLQTNNFTFKSYSIDPFTSELDGMISEQYFLNIRYATENEEDQKTARFFIKVVNGASKVMFEISKSILAFEKEKFVYEELKPLCEKSGINMDFMAKSYLCESYSVVLEDLSLSQYKTYPRKQPIDLDHCKQCLKTLARFHAAPLLYEAKKQKEVPTYSFPNEYQDVVRDMVLGSAKTEGSRYIQCSFKALFKLIELVPIANRTDDIDFCARLESVLLKIMSPNDNPIEVKSTLLHGDLWLNNFLFKYDENNRPHDAKLIDFQIVKYGPPALDVLAFIYTNTRKDFRELHFDALLHYYYKTLTELLYEDNLVNPSNFMTEQQFLQTCVPFKIVAKVFGIIDRSTTALDPNAYLDAFKTDESISYFLFEGRSDYAVKSFESNSYYRELMIEDVNELVDMLR